MQDNYILIQSSDQIKLIQSKVTRFIVFSKIKAKQLNKSQFDQKQSKNVQAFLLTKYSQQLQTEENITFQKVQKNENISINKNITNQTQRRYYNASFLRYVNPSYCRKISQAMMNLGVKMQSPTESLWLALYQIHHYRPNLNFEKYQIQTPSYGTKLLVLHQKNNQSQNKSQKLKGMPNQNNFFGDKYRSQQIISNCCRFSSQNYYFLSDILNQTQYKDFQAIISMSLKKIYGLILKVRQNILCIPFQIILSLPSSPLKIQKSMLPYLQKTCYISFLGSYCTGILISKNIIITTRHLMPKSNQKLQTQVLIKRFPYIQIQIGKIVKIGLGSLDFVQIQILKKQIKNKVVFPSQNHNKNIYFQKIHNQQQFLSKTKIPQSLQDKQKQESMANQNDKLQIKQKYNIGRQVFALGFGKFSYNINIFHKFQIVLPVIARGIISKIILQNGKPFFIKTDAKLFAGFSGSGIWSQRLVGMAVFILRNTNNNTHYNRHNFSYSLQFLNQLIRNKSKQILSQNNKYIQQFDRIQSKQQIKILNRIAPKL